MRVRAASLALVAGLSLAPVLTACGGEQEDGVEQEDGGGEEEDD